MQKLTKYAVAVTALAVVLAPSLALALTQPTVPIGNPGQQVTGSSLQRLIESVVQFLITVSVVVAVGFIIWGGLQFVRGKPDEGKKILLNGVIGVAIILGVGLILQTVSGFINRGGTIN